MGVFTVKTVSVNVMNLCVPCENRCRYCLLSYDSHTNGVDFDRSTAYAQRFFNWIQKNRPELSFLFGFGYSMEHPELKKAIEFCQSIGSATGQFLQFNGMKQRSGSQLTDFLSDLKAWGIKLIDLTFYGTEAYHDRFSARQGDFKLLTDTLLAANRVGLDSAVGIPLTHENYGQLDDLLDQLQAFTVSRTFAFVPHCEGRGQLLDKVRLTLEDYGQLSTKGKSLLNRELFRSEGEWVRSPALPKWDRRVLTLTLTPDNIDRFERMDFADTISCLERLDDDYYRTVPGFPQLLEQYGDPSGTRMYSARDLYMHYQIRYIREHQIDIYDINDERQCFSRRI